MNKIEKNENYNKSFEEIKHIDENGIEFWYAREIMPVLQYAKWQNFRKIIDKAMIACKNSEISIKDCFTNISKPIISGKGKEELVEDFKLTRYACYLIAQNGDSRKKVIALAQTYFAVQTRKQELSEKEYRLLTEDEKRFYQRDLTRKGNYSLNLAAKNAGVKNFDKFHNAGYKGLYNGETADDITKRNKGNNVMELWEVLDDNGNATGEIMEKYDQKIFDRGFYHLGADVWIINSAKKILIQKRAKQKKLEPNVWAMTGGSVILGENSKDTIVRESKEELDIDINADDLKLVTKFKTGNVWIDTYILKCNYDIAKMKFQEDEVSDVKWATWTEINDLVNKGQFIKHRWEFVSKFLKEEIIEL